MDKLQKRKNILAVILTVVIFIVDYPFLFGDYYRNNFSFMNKYANDGEYGFKIPDEYFEIKESLDNKKIDAKVLQRNI